MLYVICLCCVLYDVSCVPQMTVQGQNQKTLCCLCCASGPLSAEFSLQRRGYVPGEAVPLSAHIENSSNRLISKSHVDLKMVRRRACWTYTSPSEMSVLLYLLLTHFSL